MVGERTQADEVPPPEHLFTWVDVDEHLARLAEAAVQWPQWLLGADAWWDGLELVVRPATEPAEVHSWLNAVFGPGSVVTDGSHPILRLDDPRTPQPTGLPISLCVDDEMRKPRREPRLREKHITPFLAEPLPAPEVDGFAADVQLMAFHSFKGGVGRTVHAVAAADALAGQGASVLLVDADLEAPGITWMHRSQGGQLDFSYEDFLALLHGEEGGPEGAVEIAARYLPNQEAGHYPGPGSITVLPASRRVTLGPPRIEPADLLGPSRSSYFLTDALAALAARIGVQVVVMDLRAGASELSAPVLLDRRVQRVFVTTLSDQSLTGTCEFVRQLGRRSPGRRGLDPESSVVITQYRQDAHGEQVTEAQNLLGRALGSLLPAAGTSGADRNRDARDIDTDVLITAVKSPFREELLALPPGWNSVLAAVERASLKGVLQPVLPTIDRGRPPRTTSGERDIDALRGDLARTARRLTYAESEGLSSASGFLVTGPIRNLLSEHRTELPVALVTGAKGSGKTFTFVTLCAARTWSEFARRSEVTGVGLDAPIVPVLEPTALRQDDVTPQDLRDAFARERDGAVAENGFAIRDRLTRGVAELGEEDAVGWRKLWLRCLAGAAGLSAEQVTDPEEALMELGRRQQVVFVVDGLEDVFQTLDTKVKQTALRVLLVDVLGWLRSLRGRPLGLIVFVRRDLVGRAVHQNTGQLLHRYDSYALRWDEQEALRLALWVAVRAEALDQPAKAVTDLSYDELVTALTALWGRKLGTETSKEARSHLWVPAALGDFQGQVQARDVVVFLGEAARLSAQQKGWPDRVLTPAAMRRALLECSTNKIDEIRQENPEVGALLTHMRQYGGTVTVPFPLADVGLDTDQAEFLVRSGVFTRGDDGRYWVPEIYRHGLGFGSERRARVLWR
ncbi:hypothetical protein GCM10009716_03530 [Streptomyces sodiiphilus]|uniref:CobQ/CobB/MinD/ParA nucleotide binding domain-containing protein n=1 Tax=Streptomyces sodiiphilus TaxID=226217 RepID=A0ABN2NSX3_9ACTN